MIISFETESTPVMESFFSKYGTRKGIVKQMLYSMTAVEDRIHRIGNLYIIHQKTFFDPVFKFAALGGVGMMILGIFMNSSLLIQIGFCVFLAMMMFLSRYSRFYAMRVKLWFKGQRVKMSLVNHAYLEEKLIFELESRGLLDEPKRSI